MPVKVNLKVIEIWNNDSMENAVRAYEAEGPQPKGSRIKNRLTGDDSSTVLFYFLMNFSSPGASSAETNLSTVM